MHFSYFKQRANLKSIMLVNSIFTPGLQFSIFCLMLAMPNFCFKIIDKINCVQFLQQLWNWHSQKFNGIKTYLLYLCLFSFRTVFLSIPTWICFRSWHVMVVHLTETSTQKYNGVPLLSMFVYEYLLIHIWFDIKKNYFEYAFN